MAELEIRSPGVPVRQVTLGESAVLGRGDDCDIQILEPKASRRHLRLTLEPRADGARGGSSARGPHVWSLEDLDSSNGTFVGDVRVLRARLNHGDILRVGDTVLVFLDPVPVGLVGGTLKLRALGGSPPTPAALKAPPAPPAPLLSSPQALPQPLLAPSSPDLRVEEGPGSSGLQTLPPPLARLRPLDMRAFGRALTLALIGLAVLVGVQLLLGARARRAQDDLRARHALAELLPTSRVDRTAFERLAGEWLATQGASSGLAPERELLRRHLAASRGEQGVRSNVRDRLESLMQRLGSVPEGQARAELLGLRRLLPEDPTLAEQVRLAFVELDRRRAAFERSEGLRVRQEAEELLAQNLPGEAQRRLAAFRAGRGRLGTAEDGALRAVEERAAEAIRTLAATTLLAVGKEPDRARQRALLQSAWPGLAGTSEQAAIADALRYASQPLRSTPGAPSGQPTTPEPSETLLAQAADAERLFAARRWSEARLAFVALGQLSGVPALLKQEWSLRLTDVDLVLGLVTALGQEAEGGGARRTLSSGAVVVAAADAAGVTLKPAANTADPGTRRAWQEVEPDDLLALLALANPSRGQRFGLAVLAASVSKPEALTAALLPLYQAGPAGPEVDAVVARLLEGKAQPPEGGYRVFEGELVDRAGYERRLEAKRLVALASEARGLLERLAKEPSLKKLERLREARAELDRRRLHALLAIFNEKHYPYPYQRGQPPYTIVQAEIDRRVAAVRELWDGDDHVKLSRAGAAGKLVDQVLAAVSELEARGRDVGDMRAQVERVEPYLTGETIRLRDFGLNAGERGLLAYNRWVREVYNPAQTAYASDLELKQIEITNAYRMMLGFTVTVRPGDAAYEAIDDTTVARILDAGRIEPTSVTGLRACRVDDRLVRSARLHSQDMARRGYFDHFSPPDPATGAPRKSPFDRMREAGYEGGGGSENIASVGGDPLSPHEAWCHSSGHHRNLLSNWIDMGSGQAGGRLWTQNFGAGGGRPARIEALPAAPKR